MWRRVEVADPKGRQHAFGQAGQVHRALRCIGGQGFVVRRRFEETVDIVIHDEQVELAGNLGDSLATRVRHYRVGRVLVSGHTYQQRRAVLQAGGPQSLGNQAVLVHGYPAQAAAHAVGKGNDARVAERLAEDHIIALRQAADGHQQAMLGAGGQHHLLRASFGQPALNPCGASLLVRRMATVGNVVEHLVKVGG
ncbi:hypothetical protein D3C81_1443860 [compost metagenome]